MKVLYRSFFFLLWLVVVPVWAQDSADSQLTIHDLNHSNFPIVTLDISADDPQGNGVSDWSGLNLAENGESRTDFELQPVAKGADITFVIDGNSALLAIDEIGGVSRLAKVRTAIGNYAQKITPLGQDRISVVVVSADNQPTYLIKDATTSETVITAINSYNPAALPDRAPLQELLTLAFETIAQTPSKQYQAVVLFSNAEFMREQLNFFELRDSAEKSDVTFFGAILGKVASQEEIDNMAELYIPTNGYAVHVPQPESFESLIETLKSQSVQYQLSYRSQATTSGTQQIELSLAGQTITQSFNATLSPAMITITAPTAPIIRKVDENRPNTDWLPTNQLVTAQLLWPDGQPRKLAQFYFYVDGAEQTLAEPPVFDQSGLLSWEWEFASLIEGEHQLKIKVVDELGVSAESPPLTQTITFQYPISPTTPTPLPSPTPAPSWLSSWQKSLNEDTLINVTLGVIALLLLIAAWKLRQKRQKESAESTVPAEPMPAPPPDPIISSPKSYLELAEAIIDGQRFTGLVALTKLNTVIGSEPMLANIIFSEPSVSRVHASIKLENQRYLLYDEGSAYGTRLNFERLGLSPRFLKDGDEIEWGSVKAKFHLLPAKEQTNA